MPVIFFVILGIILGIYFAGRPGRKFNKFVKMVQETEENEKMGIYPIWIGGISRKDGDIVTIKESYPGYSSSPVGEYRIIRKRFPDIHEGGYIYWGKLISKSIRGCLNFD